MKYFRTATAAELLKSILVETRKGYMMVSTLMDSNKIDSLHHFHDPVQSKHEQDDGLLNAP